VLWFGGPVLDAVPGAGVFKGMGAEDLTIGHGLSDLRNGRPSSTGRRELDRLVDQHRMDRIGNGLDQVPQEVSADPRRRALMQLD
jgi:hypothetical protein